MLVLDLTARCDVEAAPCAALIDGVGAFLERARRAHVLIVFTTSHSSIGTPEGLVARGLHHRTSEEPLIGPDGFDKFTGGELHALLSNRGIKDLVIVGSSIHVAVLYTATAATRVYRYNVAIPLDGVNTRHAFEHEYALHQLTVLPLPAACPPIQFTTLETVEFAG